MKFNNTSYLRGAMQRLQQDRVALCLKTNFAIVIEKKKKKNESKSEQKNTYYRSCKDTERRAGTERNL